MNWVKSSILLICCVSLLGGPTVTPCCLGNSPLDSDWGEDQYAIAAQHYRQQRWAQAVGQFELLIDRQPAHVRVPLAHFFIAESFVQLQDYQSSLTHFRTFLERDPEHALAIRARFRLGEALYLLGVDQESIAELEILLAEDRERTLSEFALVYLGEMLLRLPDSSPWQRAATHLQRVLTEYPESTLAPRAALGLAQAQQRLGDVAASEATLERLRNAPHLAPEIEEEAILALAAIWIESGRAADVPPALTEAALEKMTPPNFARGSYWRGRAELALQNWPVAAKFLEQAVDQLPEDRLNQAAIYDAAIAHWQAGNRPQAVNWLSQLTTRWPTGQWAAEADFLLLQAAWDTQDIERVSPLTQAFIVKYPDHDLAIKAIEIEGRRALKQGHHDVAQRHFQQLIGRKPSAGGPDSFTRATWNYLLAIALVGQQKYEQGLTAVEHCLELLPDTVTKDDRDATAKPSLDVRLIQMVDAESVDEQPSPTDRLEEQARFTQASSLARLQRWAEALDAQEALLLRFPRSHFRHEVLADRLLALASARSWDEYQKIAEVAVKWLEQDQTEIQSGEAERPKNRLLETLSRTSLQRAEQLYKSEDYASAARWFDVASRSSEPPISEQALSGLAWSQFQNQSPAEQEKAATLLLNRFPDSLLSAEVGLKMAARHVAQRQRPQAEQLLDMLVTRFPTWSRRHQVLAMQSKLQSSDRTPATTPLAIALLEQALQAIPVNEAETSSGATFAASYLYDLAWLYHDIGQTELAFQQFEKINVGHPQSSVWADATFRLAQNHFANQRWALATDLLQQIFIYQASGENPSNDSRTIPTLSVSHKNTSESSATHSGLEDTGRVSLEILCHSYYLRAMIGVAEKDWPTVSQCSQRLVEQYPDHHLRWIAQFWWGEAQFRMQQYAETIDLLTAILPRTDHANESWVAMSHLRLAQALGHQDRWREVLLIAEPARSRFIDFAQAYELDYLIGRALAADGKFAEARSAYQRVVESPPGKKTETAAMAQWMIGETYFHQEQYALAAEAYHRTEVLHRFPQWQAVALLQAGKCYENLGRNNEASGVYRQLLSEHAGSTLTEQAQHRLENLPPDRNQSPRRPTATGRNP